ncbi:MAG TPA: PBP1A family penicillin-binding protein [Myxococcota bacterium]|nr:PBP1A family penicillin-binding protein [Myxococcota bacterium]
MAISRNRRRRGGWLGGLGWSLRLAGIALFLASAALGGITGRQLVLLDRIVRARFEGTLFRVPSRVLSAPLILYPGLDFELIDLRGTLDRLGYRESPGDSPRLGRYRWSPREVRIHRRAFEHPSRAEPARLVALQLAGRSIDGIRDLQTKREIGALFLEPEQVGAYYGPDREQRELVRIDDVPQQMVAAVMAVEDQRFYRHMGLDFWRIGGAMAANLRAGSFVQGGSTLTQQLMKNFFLTPDRSLKRKLQEAAMALITEARYEKAAILEAYLNEIYLGQRGATQIHGIGEAARFYFGKPVRDLSLAECALIAGLIQSPNGLSPHRAPEQAQARRDLVLRLMLQQGKVTQDEFAEATAEPLRVATVTPDLRDARFFLDALRRELPNYYGEENLAAEGLRIYSTLDLRLQRAASRVVSEELARLEKQSRFLAPKGESRLEACLVALRPQTGEVLALVGGRDYSASQFDRCTQARRPAGSLFKAFVYAAALEPASGAPAITLASALDDSELSVPVWRNVWTPQNFDHQYHGTVPVRLAFEKSYNVAAARLGQIIGIPRVREMAQRLGIESPLPNVPSLALGSGDVTPLELARSYATFASGGIRPRVRTFEDVIDARGETLERQSIEFERVLDSGTAFLMTSLLQGVVDHGTGYGIRAAGVTGPVAGKTGTSDEERDAWFAGFTPEMVVVLWVGFDEPRRLGQAAAQIAVPIWARFVKEASGGEVAGVFPVPGDVAELEIEPLTGAIALDGCPERRTEFFLRGTEPVETCPQWRGSQPMPPQPRDFEPAAPEPPERRRERSDDEPGLIERFRRWLEEG